MEKQEDTRLEDYRESALTYHVRFTRICKEISAATNNLNALTTKWEGHLPQDFVNAHLPIFENFTELYTESGECMGLIGNNQAAFNNIVLEEMNVRDRRIEILEELVTVHKKADKITDGIIKSQETLIKTLGETNNLLTPQESS